MCHLSPLVGWLIDLIDELIRSDLIGGDVLQIGGSSVLLV